jgi:hypothetical protein
VSFHNRRIRKLSPSVIGDTLYKNFHDYKDKGGLKNPDMVAKLAVFLASESSNHLNGYIGTLTDYIRLGWKDN